MSLVAAFLFSLSFLSLLLPVCSGTAMDIEEPIRTPMFPICPTDAVVDSIRSIVEQDNWQQLEIFVKAYGIQFMEFEIFDGAAFYGSLMILDMLWSARKLNHLLNEKQALVYAASNGQWETFEWLTENCRCHVEDDCYYPLGVAISYGHAMLVLNIIEKYSIRSRAVDYSFINNAMLENYYVTICILMSYNWIMPLELFPDICALGYLKLVKFIFVRQSHTITRNHIIKAIHCCSRSKAFDVIRFLLKRSDQIEGAINDALDYAIKRICHRKDPDPSYMELVRIFVYDGRASFSRDMLIRADCKEFYHIFGLRQSGQIKYIHKTWLDFYELPVFNNPSCPFTFECFESGLRWSILKGDTSLAMQFLRADTRKALVNVPSASAWLNFMDHLVSLAQKCQMKLILRTIVELISIRCTQGHYEGGYLPVYDARFLQRVHLSLYDLSMRYWRRDFMALSLLLHRYSIHVLTIVGFLTIGIPVNEDVSSRILEDALLL